MKKRKFIVAGLSSLLVFGSAAAMTACGPSKEMPVEEVNLESIELITDDAKTAYYEGDTFDKSGLLVKATFSDGQESFVGNYTFSPDGPLTTADTKVTISYTFEEVTKTADLPITVTALAETGLRLAGTGSGRNQRPITTTYTEGQSFAANSMTVYLQYNSGKETVVPAGEYTYTPNGALTTADTKITVSYHGFTAEVTITVNPAS